MLNLMDVSARNRSVLLRLLVFALSIAVISIIAGCSGDDDNPTGGGNGGALPDTVFYGDVQPIFGSPSSAGNCATSSCHDATAPEQGLNMTTFATIMAGSNSGPVVVAGNAAQSELYKRITGVSTPQMPLGGSLSISQIELIEKWIDDGALE